VQRCKKDKYDDYSLIFNHCKNLSKIIISNIKAYPTNIYIVDCPKISCDMICDSFNDKRELLYSPNVYIIEDGNLINYKLYGSNTKVNSQIKKIIELKTQLLEDIYKNPTINIGIVGCISSGKSTLMNSLFSETHSDMKIKKTTMCPQVYKTDRKLAEDKTYAKTIRKQNKALNKKLYKEGVSNKYEEVTYNVLPIPEH